VAYRIKSGDTKPLDATLREGGTSGPAIPLVGATVRFRMRAVLGGPLPGGVCTLTDASAGKVRYVWQREFFESQPSLGSREAPSVVLRPFTR
jgi:hypothetical protein